MNEHERLEEFELANGEVSGPGSLLALSAKDTDPNMRGEYHVNIVSSITDSQCDLGWESITNHFNDVSFLLRRNATRQNDVSMVGCLTELLLEHYIVSDHGQAITSDNDCPLAAIIDVWVCLFDLLSKVGGVSGLNLELVHFLIEKSCSRANINGGTDLITRKNPHLDASSLHEADSVSNVVLQAVFDGC
jgi:hypothetical protein